MDAHIFYLINSLNSGQNITIQPIPSCQRDEDSSSSVDEDEVYPPAVEVDVEVDSGDEALQNYEAPISSLLQPEKRKPLWETVEVGTSAKEVPKWKSQLTRSKSLLTPVQYFKNFFDDDLLQFIVEQSNLYALQTNPANPLHLTQGELEQFLGTVVFTSVFPLPKTRMYWRTSSRVAQIADVFTRRRWEAIKNLIHFNDNSEMSPTTNNQRDKLFKIRPVIDSLLCKFKKIPLEQILFIDEQIVPFKDHSSRNQYDPNKAHEWGYKIFVLSDTHGLVYNFEIYTGKINPVPNHPDFDACSNVVLKLAQVIPDDKSHLLYFDSWFSSPKLISELSQKGIYTLGTPRQNRQKGCQNFDDDTLKKYEEKEGTVVGVETGNKFMGNDDGLMAYYRTKMHSKKFYHRLFFHLLDMVVINCWLLYKRDVQNLEVPKARQYDYIGFRIKIAVSLIGQNKVFTKRRGQSISWAGSNEKEGTVKKRSGIVAPTPAKDVRKDKYAHWPVPSDRQRCKLPSCKKKSAMKCQKCDVHLCLNRSSNCFYDFHTD